MGIMEKLAGFRQIKRDSDQRAGACYASPCLFGKEKLNRLFPGLLLIAMAMPMPALAGQLGLSELSFEQLMDIQVTSVAKKQQKVSESAAAITSLPRKIFAAPA